jgi:hypothetical protein
LPSILIVARAILRTVDAMVRMQHRIAMRQQVTTLGAEWQGSERRETSRHKCGRDPSPRA